MDLKPSRWPAWARVALAALLVQFAFQTALPGTGQYPDFESFYRPVARSLLAGEGLVQPDGEPALRYPPGFPMILAALFASGDSLGVGETALLRALSVACFVLTTVEVHAIARLISSSGTAWLAALAWMSYPPHLWLTRAANSELPFSVAFLAAVYLVAAGVARQRSSAWLGFLAGALVGCASLIRPIGVALAMPLCAALLLAPRPAFRARAAFAVALILGNLTVIAPWELWGYDRTGRWIPLSTGGRLSVLDGLTFGVKPWLSGEEMPVPAGARRLMAEIRDHYGDLRTVGDAGRFLASSFASEPRPVIELAVLKAARAWYGTDSQRRERLLLVLQIPYLLAIAAGAATVYRRGGIARWQTGLTLALTTYFWLMTILVLSILRYMMPVVGLLLILPAVALGDRRRGLAA